MPYSVVPITFKAAPFSSIVHMLLSLIQAILPTAAIALATANFIDTATAILQGELTRGDIYMPLVILLIVLCLLNTNQTVINLFAARMRLGLRRTLNPQMVRKHAELDFKHIENAGSWELISRVTRSPADAIMNGYSGFIKFGVIILSIGSILGLIVTQVWWAAVVIVSFSIPLFWISMWAGKKNYQAERDVEKFNRRTDYLAEVLTGRENIDERSVFGYGEEVIKDWRSQFEAGRVHQLKVTAKTFSVLCGSGMGLSFISILVTLTLINPVITGDLSAGMFMGIVGAVFAMMHMLGWELSDSLSSISRTGEYLKDMAEFNTLSTSEGALAESDTQPPVFESLEFRNVRFKYPTGEHYILDSLSFKLEKEKHYAFVGKNGAGKTTITKLLTGLYTEYEGEILVNGKELRSYPASTLKAMFSVVYQDFARYFISFADNIALGDKNSNSRVAEIASQAGLDDTIAELKEGMKTPLGKIKERGQDLSGGQWQRIAIARSLISRAPVKMLDEPTAALDPISESRVYEEFEKLMKNKTTVFISHRLGSTKLADEILVIDNGQIAERGTHDELMALNKTYAEMFESQRGWYQ